MIRALLIALLLLLVACADPTAPAAPELPPAVVDCYDLDLGHYVPCPEEN